MNIKGVSVNAEAIGAGLYGMIADKGEEAIVAFGMLPKWAMDMAETAVRQKIISIAAEQVGCSPRDVLPFIGETELSAIVNPIMKEIACAILKAAADKGKLLV